MPHLIIDDRPIDVAPGTKVIDAAEQLGIMIPRFCYLKVLGAVGACRMCAVHFLAGPVKGIEMSCMVETEDDMVVSTTDPEAVAFRRQIIEWLMANHPHDCPVCDEGGQCLLQDETVSGGHGLRRYPGKKRTYRDQDLGVFIQQEMNRCIHCYRCVRFYQEYAGYRDFGVMQIGNRIFYGRFDEGPLASPFAGNLVDICPTGVFTDKPARYKARRWDMQRAPSICLHCSLGCSTVGSSYHRAMVRVEARQNESINADFICDRGRFGCFFADHPQRPWQPRVNAEETDWRQAMTTAVSRLQRIIVKDGPAAVAVLGSGRSSLETMLTLSQLSEKQGCRTPCFFIDPGLAHQTQRSVTRLDEGLGVNMGDIRQADFLLVAGVDPVNEAPMLALSLRQVATQGATVVVIDPRPVALPCEFIHIPAEPGKLEESLARLVKQALLPDKTAGLSEALRKFVDDLPEESTLPIQLKEPIREAAASLAASRNPVMICGTEAVRDTTPDLVADLAGLLHSVIGKCGLFYVFPEANSFGAALTSSQKETSFVELLQSMENGGVKALLVIEADPVRHFADRERLRRALDRLDLLIITCDYLPSDTTALAHILLPTASPFETGGSYINQAGYLQYAHPVRGAGPPLVQLSHGSHPPRSYAPVPGDAHKPRPAWRVIQELVSALSPHTESTTKSPDFFALAGAENPAWDRLRFLPYPADGVNLAARGDKPTVAMQTQGQTQGPRLEKRQPDNMELVMTQWTFGTEELSSCAGPIQQAEPDPHLVMHVDDAARAGLANGDTVTLHLDRGVLQLPIRIATSMATGVAVLPRHHRLHWQQIKYDHETLPLCRIEKS